MSALLTWLAHGSVLVALASLVMCRGRGPNAATRYLLWWAVMAALLALPVAHALASSTLAMAPAAITPAPGATAVASTPLALVLPHEIAAAAPWLAASVAALMLWRLWLLARAASRLRCVRESCLPLPDGLERRLPLWCAARDGGRPVRLLASPDLHTPSVLGVPPGERGVPIIGLPLWTLEALDVESLDLIVLHELAHIERGDDRDLLIQAAIAALFCWHPAVWWVARRLDEERERACDDEVVRRTDRAAQYARCLVGVAAHTGAGPSLLAAPGVGRRGRRLAQRVERLLAAQASRSGRRSRARRLVWVGATLTGLALAVVVSAAGAPRVHVPEPKWDSMRTSSMTTVVLRQPAASVRGDVLPQAEPPAPRTAPSRRAWREAPPAPRVTAVDIADTERVAAPSVVEPPVAAAANPAVEERPDPAPTIAGDMLSAAAVVALPSPLLPSPVLPAPQRPTSSDPSPWKRTGDAGQSIGKGAAQAGESIGKASAQAGVKTAGFFSRMGRAVASSF